MGQGLNTKAVQVAGHVLGLPVDKISVKHSRSATAPNNAVTGASMSSEAVAYVSILYRLLRGSLQLHLPNFFSRQSRWLVTS